MVDGNDEQTSTRDDGVSHRDNTKDASVNIPVAVVSHRLSDA